MPINTSNEESYVVDLTTFNPRPTFGVDGPFSWTGNSGQSAAIGYSFNPASSYYSSFQSYDALTAGSQGFIAQALNAWSSVANITFSIDNSSPEIVFSENSDVGAAEGAVAPHVVDGTNLERADVYFDDDLANQNVGGSGFETILHEIGHAIGLNHPGDDPDNSAYSTNTTVMSYNDGNIAEVSGLRAITPMIYDIAAAQFLYGANYNFNNTATTYTLNGSSNQAATIWDGGGTDTLTVSGSGNATLDLRGGVDSTGDPYWSHLGNDYTAIAFDPANASGVVEIEKAIGGSGNDTIYGGVVSNPELRGNGGNDVIYGDGDKGSGMTFGSDTIYGDAGADTIYGDRDNASDTDDIITRVSRRPI